MNAKMMAMAIFVANFAAVTGCMSVDEMLASSNPVFRALGESQTVNLAIDASRSHTEAERAEAVGKLSNQDKIAEIVISGDATPEVRKLAQGKITEPKVAARIAAEVDSDEIAQVNVAMVKDDLTLIEAGFSAVVKKRYSRAEAIVARVKSDGLISDRLRSVIEKDGKLENKLRTGGAQTAQEEATIEELRILNYRFGLALVNAMHSAGSIKPFIEDRSVANKYGSRNESGFDYYDPLVVRYVKVMEDPISCKNIVLGKMTFDGFSGQEDLKAIALGKIRDDGVLYEIYSATKSADALARIKSVDVLKRVFLNAEGSSIDREVLARIDNQSFFIELANGAKDLEVRKVAIELIRDSVAKEQAQKALDGEIALRKAAEEKAQAEKKAAHEKAVAAKKAADEKFEKELPGKIAEFDRLYHFKTFTLCPEKEKKFKAFAVMMYQKKGLPKEQIVMGLDTLDQKLLEMPSDQVEHHEMALDAMLKAFDPRKPLEDFEKELMNSIRELDPMGAK